MKQNERDRRPFASWLRDTVEAKQREHGRRSVWTQRQIAKRAGVNCGYFNQIISAERTPSDEIVAALAGAMGASAKGCIALANQQRLNIHDEERAAMVKRLPKRKSRTERMEARAS